MRLTVKDVEFRYTSVPILSEVNLEVAAAEILGVVGPNGAGKTTLLRCIDRILRPQKGCILVDTQDIQKLSRMELARAIGYIPQSVSPVFPVTVFDAVLMGRRPYISWRASDADRDKVLQTLYLLHIEDLAMREIHELSGGQLQKVFIARALAQEPAVLLLDEPTSNLDIKHQLEVLGLIKSVVKEKGISAIMAIHDLNLAARYADRIIMMNRGMIVSAGDPVSVLTRENIQQVYGVEATVNYNSGKPFIIPLRPLNHNRSEGTGSD